MKKRSDRRPPLEPTRDDFITAVADLLEAAEAMVSGGIKIGPNMERFSPEKADVLQSNFIGLAYTYVGLVQQVFEISRDDLERGAAAMLDHVTDVEHVNTTN